MPLASRCSQWLWGCGLSCSLPYRHSACSSIISVPGAHGGVFGAVTSPLNGHVTPELGEGYKTSMGCPQDMGSSCIASCPGSGGLSPMACLHLCAHDFGVCSSPLAQSSLVVVLSCWKHQSWPVPGAQLGGLQPPRCSKDQLPCSRQPHPCFHNFSQHGHILQRPGAVPSSTEPQQRAGLPTGHCPGQALWLCRSGCNCAAAIGEACRESCSFSYVSGTAPLPLCFHLTTTSRAKWLSDLIFYLN